MGTLTEDHETPQGLKEGLCRDLSCCSFWRIMNQAYEAGSNILGQGCNAMMELGQGGRHVVDRKLGLSLEELYFGRIRPEGGQLDGDCCERDLAIRVSRTLFCGRHLYFHWKRNRTS